MRIIPVIDLKGGQVVHGIGGRRDQYRPIASQLVRGANPAEVAQAFVEQLKLTTLYVADLDAIGGGQPDWRSYEAIARSGAVLWLDAGTGECNQARELTALPFVERVVVGLESLHSPEALSEILSQLGSELAIFSLDLKSGAPIVAINAWKGLTAAQISSEAVRLGITRMIVLDLAAVGSSAGPSTIDLLRALRVKHPEVELIAGGGVRHQADVAAFSQAGADAVLVASALHAGVPLG